MRRCSLGEGKVAVCLVWSKNQLETLSTGESYTLTNKYQANKTTNQQKKNPNTLEIWSQNYIESYLKELFKKVFK